MKDHRLQQNRLGFWELIQKPSPQELLEYYEKNYFQNEKSNYRKKYSALETEVIDLRITLRAAKVAELTGRTKTGRMLDVGCGEGFVISHYHTLGWSVVGIDFSRSGVQASKI